MNKVKTFLLLLISFILQTTVFSKINIFGANVNILIPALVAISQFLGGKTGGYSGLILGLVEDFLLTSFIGVRALSYYLIGYVVGSKDFKLPRDRASGALITVGASIFNFLLVSAIYFLLGKSSADILAYLPLGLIIEVVFNGLIYILYNLIVGKIMYLPTYRI